MAMAASKVSNQSGSITIFVLVSMAAAFIMFLAFMSGISKQINLQLKEQKKFGIEFMKEKVKGTLSNEFAWRRTIAADVQFNCLQTAGSTCSPSAISLFSLRNSQNTIIIDAQASSGFDMYGQACNTFSTTSPNDNCPFRYEMTWRCDGPCAATEFLPGRPLPINPKIVVDVSLKVSASPNYLQLNPANYSFTQTVGWEERNLASICNSLAGYFNDTTGKCNLLSPNSGSRCSGASEYVAGIDQYGTPICGTFKTLARSCPNNYAVVGIEADGSLKCDKF